MGNGGKGADSKSSRRTRLYENLEICLSCVMWPTAAVASAAVLYWIWLGKPGLGALIASSVFVIVFVAATICALNNLVSLIARLLDPHTPNES